MESIGIHTVEVETIWQALAVRTIRNQCCEYMTIDSKKIGIARQVLWFYRKYLPAKKRGELIVYLAYFRGKPAGYGLIRGRTVHPVISGGVAKKWRGMGVGGQLFRFLAREASRMERVVGRRAVFLEVRADNPIALALYTKIGFVEKMREGGIISMQFDYGEFG